MESVGMGRVLSRVAFIVVVVLGLFALFDLRQPRSDIALPPLETQQ